MGGFNTSRLLQLVYITLIFVHKEDVVTVPIVFAPTHPPNIYWQVVATGQLNAGIDSRE